MAQLNNSWTEHPKISVLLQGSLLLGLDLPRSSSDTTGNFQRLFKAKLPDWFLQNQWLHLLLGLGFHVWLTRWITTFSQLLQIILKMYSATIKAGASDNDLHFHFKKHYTLVEWTLTSQFIKNKLSRMHAFTQSVNSLQQHIACNDADRGQSNILETSNMACLLVPDFKCSDNDLKMLQKK